MIHVITDQWDAVGAWIARQVGDNWVQGQGTALGFVRENELIGGVSYYGYNGRNIWASVAATDYRCWTRKTLWAIFSYPFEQLNCERITALVDDGNDESVRFITKLGFTLEATLENAAPNGDQHLYVMHRAGCRWLKDLRFKGKHYGKEVERIAASGS